MSNATSPTPFMIAAPPMIGPLPAAIVCYILYGLGAFLPVAFIIIVAIVLNCRRRLRKSKFVGVPGTIENPMPEIRKADLSSTSTSLHGLSSLVPRVAPLQSRDGLNVTSNTAQSLDNPNVYFRQQATSTIHVKSTSNSLLVDGAKEITSGSTASGRISRQSSVSRSTLQIRRQDGLYPAGIVNGGYNSYETETETRLNQDDQQIISNNRNDVSFRSGIKMAWQVESEDGLAVPSDANVPRTSDVVERRSELIDNDQEQALR
jgi:hypothetical protein